MELIGYEQDRLGLGRMLRDEHRYAIGLDLGKSGDPSALAIVEEVQRTYEGRDRFSAMRRETRELNCRYLRRWPLGTPYYTVADDVPFELRFADGQLSAIGAPAALRLVTEIFS